MSTSSSVLDIDITGRLGSLQVALQACIETSPALIIGANGAGKSTLLRAIAGARLPLTGRITLGRRTLLDSACAIDVPTHERRIGYVPQGYGLFPHLNALANVAFGCGRGEKARKRALDALARVDASHLRGRYPANLSGGEKQRVALARALAIEPDALLLDEPLAALDPGARRRMRTALSDYLAAADCPALIVTHDLRDVRALAATVLVVEQGSVTQSGTAAEVSAAPSGAFAGEFFDVHP